MEHLGFPLSSHRQGKEATEEYKLWRDMLREKHESHVTRAKKDAESSLSYKTTLYGQFSTPEI